MATFDSLPESDQNIVRDMSRAVSAVLRDNDIQRLQDDRGAILDEACAFYLVQCRDAARARRSVCARNR